MQYILIVMYFSIAGNGSKVPSGFPAEFDDKPACEAVVKTIKDASRATGLNIAFIGCFAKATEKS